MLAVSVRCNLLGRKMRSDLCNVWNKKGKIADSKQAPQRTRSSSTLLVTSSTLAAPATPSTLTASSGSPSPVRSLSPAAWSADPRTRCTTLDPQMILTRITTTTPRTHTPSLRTWLISSSPSTSTDRCLYEYGGVCVRQRPM